MSHRLQRLFAPASVAVVGVSPKGGYGLGTVRNLERFGFPGRIYPVNPRYDEIDGRQAWPTLASLPESVDAVGISVPALATPAIIREAIEAGAGGAVAFAAGFAEVGAEGAALQTEIATLGRETGFPVIGPNCLGVVNYLDRTPLWSITPGGRTEPGSVALVGQSGNILLSLMSSITVPPLAYAVSCGNQTVVDAVEIMDYFLEDSRVRVIVAVLEGIRDVPGFRRMAARAADRQVPIVALKLGRSERGSRAAIAHTGSLTGASHLVEALFEECGVIRVDDLGEIGATAALLAAARRPNGMGLGVTASSGGECGLVSDLATEAGLVLPELPVEQREKVVPLLPSFARPSNPLDITAVGWGVREISRETVSVLAETPGVDLVASIGQASSYSGPMADIGWEPMVAGLGDVAANGNVPVVLISTVTDVQAELVQALAEHDVPVLAGTRTAIRSIANAGRYAVWQRERPAPAAPHTVDDARRAQALALLPPAGSGGVSESVSKQIARLYGIPIPDGGLATSPEMARDIAERIGYPVVLKIEAEGLHHKTEVGGVVIGVNSGDGVAADYAALTQRVASARPEATINGVRIERMVSGGVELVVGGTRDEQFGPVVVVGAGGVLIEVLRDTVHHLAPVDAPTACRMLQRLRSRALLDGYRGAAAADVTSVTNAIAGVSALLTELPEVREIDINPLVALEKGAGCIALDCLLVV